MNDIALNMRVFDREALVLMPWLHLLTSCTEYEQCTLKGPRPCLMCDVVRLSLKPSNERALASLSCFLANWS